MILVIITVKHNTLIMCKWDSEKIVCIKMMCQMH